MRISDWSSDVCSSDLWKDLPEEVRFVILHGTSGKPVTLRFVDGRKSYEVKKPFEGVIGNLNRRLLQTESAWMREELSKYQAEAMTMVCAQVMGNHTTCTIAGASGHFEQIGRAHV